MKSRLFFLIVLVVFLFTVPANAQSGEPPIPNSPPSNNYVLDTLNWLSESQEQEINTIARQLDSEGKAQIYIATLDDCGNDKIQYRRDVFNAWKIGTQKSDGGLLILVCWYDWDKSQRSVEVKTDEKMQRVIPDSLTATTAENYFIPAFKENQPGVGLVKMVKAFDNIIRGKNSVNNPLSFFSQISDNLYVILFVIIIILLSIDWKRLMRGEGFGWRGGNDGGDYYGGDGGGGDSGGGDGGDGGGSSTNF